MAKRKLDQSRHGTLVPAWLGGRLALVVVIAIFVAGGAVYLLKVSHAATSSVVAEPENGTLANGATGVTDTTASGGKAVKFGLVTPPPNQTSWQDNPKLYPPEGKVLFGVLDHSATAVTAMQAQFGRHFDLTTTYNIPLSVTPAAKAQTELNAGRTPRVDLDFARGYGMLGYSMTDAANGKDLWAAIAAGSFDADRAAANNKAYVGIDSILTSLKNLKPGAAQTNKIIVSIGHEADLVNESGGYNGVRAGSAADFRAMWQHVYTRAQALGVTNVAWFFDMAYNPQSGGGAYKWGDTIGDTYSDGMYPGNKYVDWVGWDPYNWDGVPGHPNTWQSFATIQNTQAQMTWWHAHFKIGGTATGSDVYKPVMLGETGTEERTTAMTTGESGDAQAWLDNMATYVDTGAGAGIIKGLVYFSVDYGPNSANFALEPASSHPQKWAGLKDLGTQAVFKQN